MHSIKHLFNRGATKEFIILLITINQYNELFIYMKLGAISEGMQAPKGKQRYFSAGGKETV